MLRRISRIDKLELSFGKIYTTFFLDFSLSIPLWYRKAIFVSRFFQCKSKSASLPWAATHINGLFVGFHNMLDN